MSLAIINGIITSIILETIILLKQKLNFLAAFKTACGMSLISMISMEVAMNLTDYLLVGSARLVKKLYKKFSPYCSVATWYLWRSIDDEPIQY